MPLIDTSRQAISKRAVYASTKHEISSKPLDVALDLNIDRDNAAQIARQAVYSYTHNLIRLKAVTEDAVAAFFASSF